MSADSASIRYFTFSDDISHKFWQIAVEGTAFTVTYGRIGSAGQSSTKTFESAEKCSAEAEKIIREKIGKGYAEEVDGAAGAAPVKPGRTRASTSGAADAQATISAYDALLEHGKATQLLPFLQTVDKAHHSALRKRIKAARRYYDEYVELRPGEGSNTAKEKAWGYRGTAAQRVMSEFAGLALLPRDELKSFSFLHYLSNWEWRTAAMEILDWARPTWFTDYVLERSRAEIYETPQYQTLRSWEEHGYIQFRPELFARSITHYNPYHVNYRTPPLSQEYVDYLCADEVAYTRDIPLLFEYETDAQNTAGWEAAPGEKRQQKAPVWPRVFSRLLAEGKLDRKHFLEACVTLQTKEWNGALCGFFRREAEAMQPSKEEWLAAQAMLFPLLGAAHPHVVNWAVGILKDISTEEGFRTGELSGWAPAVMLRSDCKTAVKTLLSVFEKALKSSPALRPVLAPVIADVFLLPDLPLQTKAASLLGKYADPADAALTEKLHQYRDGLLGTLGSELAAFFAGEETSEASPVADGAAVYTYTPAVWPALADCPPVSLPATWNDFLFFIGHALASDDPLDLEVLVNAVLLPPPDAPPAGDTEQLAPYLRQLQKTQSEGWVGGYTAAWLLHALQCANYRYTYTHGYASPLPMIELQRQRLEHADSKRRAGSRLPMLSLPTHAPHWIAPAVLVQRLLDYAAAGEAADPIELAIAIARTHPEGRAEAAPACAGLEEPLKSLLHFFLTSEGNAPPLSRRGVLHRLFRKEGGTPDDEIQALWAVAARTRQPDAVLEVLSESPFAEAPNVRTPLALACSVKERWNDYRDWRTQQMTRSPSWYDLEIALPVMGASNPLLLYSADLFHHPGNHPGYVYLTAGDAAWWYSIVPQVPESFFTMVLRGACQRSELGPSAVRGLRLMLDAHFHFGAASTMVLACGLMAAKREDRALAAEVLIFHFGSGTLNAIAVGEKAGWLLQETYAPVQRFAESLALVKDVGSLLNAALKVLLEATLGALMSREELPKNTKKLLEMYLDVLVKTASPPAPAIAAWLKGDATSGVLKSIAASILKLQ